MFSTTDMPSNTSLKSIITGSGNVTEAGKVLYTRPFNDDATVVTGTILWTFCVVGITLNTLTMLVITKYQQMRNLFMLFIFSLCVSDLISAIISPLFWYRRTLGFDHWELPAFFCKVYWAGDLTTSFSTALHILSFGLLRYGSIRFPFAFKRVTLRITIAWILAIWAVAFLCGFVPFAIMFGAAKPDRYSESPDSKWPACTIRMEWYHVYVMYIRVAYVILFCIPILIIVAISVLISRAIRSQSLATACRISSGNGRALQRRRRKDRQAVTQLFFIIFLFLLGYIPFIAYELWSTSGQLPNSKYYRQLDYWIGMMEYIVMRLTECTNPIIYNLGSSKMRRYTIKYLKEMIGRGENEKRNSVVSFTDSKRCRSDTDGLK